MHRFDLLHIMVDEADEVEDTHIARHIVKVHREQAQELPAKYTTHDLQRYIRYARSFKPVLSREVQACSQAYLAKRLRLTGFEPYDFRRAHKVLVDATVLMSCCYESPAGLPNHSPLHNCTLLHQIGC